MIAAAEARLRAAVDDGAPFADELTTILDELARVRGESAERWDAIGKLAPRAKQLRGRSQDLERALRAVHERLAAPIDDDERAALRALITAALA